MKKLEVIVKDKTVLELLEDASKGDIIDLKDVVKVDVTYLEAIIEENKDKVYKAKLDDVIKLKNEECKAVVAKYIEEIKYLKQSNDDLVKIKEKEIENRYLETIKDLENRIKSMENLQRKNEELIKQSNESKINEIINKKDSLYYELKSKYEILNASLESKVKEKESELNSKYALEINELKNNNSLLKHSHASEINELKVNFNLEKEKEFNELKEKHQEELRNKEEFIYKLQRQKAELNVKQTGEDLEVWCDNEVKSYKQNGLFNCSWYKDNKKVVAEGEENGTKGDFIFEVYPDSNKKKDEMLVNVCLEMKDENPDTKKKQTNSQHYARLNENRLKKKCKYAVLVSNLENDKSNSIPIYKVEDYEDMYVVRPAYLMTFLNMITSMTVRFSELILADEKQKQSLKTQKELIETFEELKTRYLDKPLEALEKHIDGILESSNQIKNSALAIDNHCEKVKMSYIHKIESKLKDFELKSSKNIIKNLE